jgi:imidazolonepropionase-like amidohydrolase
VTRPSGGLISGQGMVIDLDGQTMEAMTVRNPVAMFARLGESVSGVTGGARGATTMRLREVLEDARAYARDRNSFERGATREFAASRLDLEALQPVLRREMPLVIEAHRASDISTAIRIAREYNLRLILAGVTEGWMVAEEIARTNTPVVVRVMENLPNSFERLGARYENAALLRQAGVQVISPAATLTTRATSVRRRATPSPTDFPMRRRCGPSPLPGAALGAAGPRHARAG